MLKSFFANALLTLSSVLVTLLLAEGVLRLVLHPDVPTAASERGYFTRFDRQLGWAPKPSVAGIHRDKGFSVFVSQNRFGLRAPDDLQTGRRGSRRRMLVLGDSFVWGFGANQDELFTDARVHGSEIELINFGVSGYGTDQELLLYRRDGVRFEVDEVVLVFTPYNDVLNNLAPIQYDYTKPYYTLEDRRLILHDDHVVDWVWRRWTNELRVGSRLLNGIDRVALQIRNATLNATAHPDVEEARNDIIPQGALSPQAQAGVAISCALLLALRDEVRAHGASFSVVFVPYKPHVIATAPANHPFVPPIAACLRAGDIPYFEPYPLFLGAAQAGAELFNPLDRHFSAAGHREFAKVFVDPAVRERARDFYARAAANRRD